MSDNTDHVLAAAISAMVETFDVADTLAHLIAACAAAYPSDAVAILLLNEHGALELLSSSSHRADEMELLQIQSDRGPCVDCLAAGEPVFARSREELIRRWGPVGEAISAAGYAEAHAFPMHWRGQTIGGLNIFVHAGQETHRALGQMYADLATLAVLQANEITADQLVARLHEAISSRAVVEQAKGVLAYRLGVDMQAAFEELRTQARDSGRNLSALAAEIVEREHAQPSSGG